MKTLRVKETFVSIQGESSFSGIPCFFIRLAGCNLRCRFCDTKEAWEEGDDRSIRSLVEEAMNSDMPILEVTGGEPLAQENAPMLISALCGISGRKVLVETNGSLDISAIHESAVTIMDVKCPSSGEHARFDEGNLERLKKHDEVKFVIADRNDYEWAVRFAQDAGLLKGSRVILFGAVHKELDPAALGGWIIQDRLPVRLQMQMHKILNVK